MKLYLDFETRSSVDLKKVGAWAYAQHPSTGILCMGWGYKSVSVARQDELYVKPALDMLMHFSGKEVFISAHNAHFEYAIYNLILHRRYGWPALWDPARWSCTMARAAACGLPLDLDSLGRVLKIKTPKDIEGRQVMQRLCKPVGVSTMHNGDPLGSPVFDNDPAKLERLYKYNAVDVQAEMEVDALLPELSPEEQKIWELDLTINRRGVQIDLELARKASAIGAVLVKDLDAQLCRLTNGEVDKATRVAAIKQYLKRELPYHAIGESLDKAGVTNLLADPSIPQKIRDVLLVRRQVGKKNSVAKYTAALEMTGADGRARGMLQYHAAHTGRWGGRGLQPQNFPKGFGQKAQDSAIYAIKNGGMTGLTEAYDDKAMDALSDSLRGLFIAGKDKQLVCADFNAIEARVLFWLANAGQALEAYRRGESPYVDMARKIYDDQTITKETHPQQYDIGKRTILGCGYGMGAQKFVDNIFAETAKKGTPVRLPFELGERAVKAYRERYSAVRNLWFAVEHAAIQAVKDPAKPHFCCDGKVAWGMSKDRRFLACRLPSGRFLRYFRPSTRLGKTPWGEEKEELCYWGEAAATHQWEQLKTYGGALVENITQAVARDLMANGMLNVEKAGFQVVLTVHDEILAEAESECINDHNGKADEFLNRFIRWICETPVWAAGIPLAAEGWIGERYRK